jgi:hypothetical protein
VRKTCADSKGRFKPTALERGVSFLVLRGGEWARRGGEGEYALLFLLMNLEHAMSIVI